MREFVPPELSERVVARPDPDVCPECHGRGWKVAADGGAGTAVRCDCQKRDRGREYLARAGIPERYRRCRLGNFSTANKNPEVHQLLVRAHSISRRYVERFFDSKENRFRETGLIYIGVPGTGKTHLAVAVLAELIERYRVRGRFVDFTALIHQIQSTFDPTSPESKHEVLDPIIKTEVLVLDELGAQKPTEWVMDTLYLIMNTRYLQRLPTIFTTNYRLETPSAVGGRPVPERQRAGLGSDAHAAREQARLEAGGPPPPRRQVNPFAALKERISPLLVSRLYEMAQPVELPSFDYRREVTMHRHRIGG